ncbi:hypothetical protein [Paenibacillus agilis]|uniref:CBM-cenC domain-containing protein n=1 Tax=Paenibacillus agilis TaxID=3020863 RepID=A0A559IX35_9BACL|nr:hypothetical protein [Paenibacillus agilis]TVX92190.1 hypothetical protein FPZ44_03430 [Paenibacillus agilis]
MKNKIKILIVVMLFSCLFMPYTHAQPFIDPFKNQHFYDEANKLTMTTFNRFGQMLMTNYHYDLNGNVVKQEQDWYKDTFEQGSFDQTRFTDGYYETKGKITNEPSKVINGSYSVVGESTSGQEWHEFLHTDISKIQFEPNTTYKVTFRYKVNQETGPNSSYYFLARTPDGGIGNDKGGTWWKGKVEEVGSKTLTFTTGSSAKYYLIWGIHKGGSLSIDDIQITKEIESFESGSYAVTVYTKGYYTREGKITNEPTKVIQGNYSVLGEAESTHDWFEFMHTDRNKIQFEPNTTYKVTFSYKVNQELGPNSYYYFIARTPDGSYEENDRGHTIWKGKAGETGSKTVAFTTGSSAKYYLIWGIHNGGSLSIDDIQITKEIESFESGGYVLPSYTKGHYTSRGKITNELSQVINGGHSVVGESASGQEWFEFLHTDISKIQFEPNTTYKVTFNYKGNQELGPNSYYYFIARTPDGSYKENDRGHKIWKGKAGEVGSKTITFTTGSSTNYYLIWGIHKGGELSIDDITIKFEK